MTRHGMARHGIARLCKRLPLLAACLLALGPLASAHADAVGPRTPIKHFVVLLEEGRSFDSLFGTYPGAEGVPANACVALTTIRCARPYPLEAATLKNLPDEDKRASGFFTLAYYTEKNTQYLWNVADQYVLFDHYFSASPINPNAANWNRMFLIAGSNGTLKRLPTQGYANVTTIFDRLEAAGVSWKFYVEGYQRDQNFHAIAEGKPAPGQVVRVPLLSIPRFVDDPALSAHIVDMSEYFSDLNNGTLPSVAYIVPKGAGEPTDKSLMLNQRHLKAVMQELMRSRYWPESALLWTHDQPDGWYDHVAPPQLGGDLAGGRVPAMLISPYAAKGKIDGTVFDHNSVLRFIESNWSLEPLSGRTAEANDLLGALNFEQTPRPAVFMPMARSAVVVKKEPVRAWIYRLYGAGLAMAALVIGPLLFLTAWRGANIVQVRSTAKLLLTARVSSNETYGGGA